MTDPGDGRVPLPVRVYAALLRAFPRAFRERYGREMVELFRADWAATAGMRRAALVSRALATVVWQGALERVGAHRFPGGSDGRRIMEGLMQDVRLALRGFRRAPGFALVTIATIALGIGAASSVFAVVDGVVLEPLPYPESDRLVGMWTTFEDQGDFGLSLAEHYDYADESRVLEALGSFSMGSATLTGQGDARRATVAWTWGDLYELIGATAALGRLPGPDDARSGAAPVAVVSHDFWRSALAADPGAVGRTLELDGVTVDLIGVMSPEVRLPRTLPEIWRPVARNRSDIVDRSGHAYDGIGRLAPSATLTTLRREIDETHARWNDVWAGSHSPGHPGHALAASALHDRWFGELRTPGMVLVVSILLVLALACANVAALLLARGEARAPDLALRRALGAGRGRIVRQLVVESLVLSVIGGALGVALASFGADGLLALEPGTLPRSDAVGLDGRVLGFSLAVTLAAGLAFGVVPAIRGGSVPEHGGARTAGPDRSLSGVLSMLVVGQVALATVLVSGAGLLSRSLVEMGRADLGFETDDRLTFTLSIPGEAYPDRAAVGGFWTEVLTGVGAVPGVEDVAVVRLLPVRDGVRREGMRVVGRDVGAGDAAAVAYGLVTPGYFRVMGIPVLEGRELQSTDEADAPWVGVVNESAARLYWPGSSPVGQEAFPLFMPESAGPVTIVGVVADVRADGARAPSTPELYLGYAQTPSGIGYARTGTVVASTAVAPAAVAAAVRSAVAAVDDGVPVTRIASLDEVAESARGQERFLAAVLGIFAVLALLIAGLGTYGVVAFAVARRTRELGVRVALGAARPRLMRDVIVRGLVLGVAGGVVGASGALALGPALEGLLFGVSARDPGSMVLGPLVLGGLVVVASLVPALRASRANPLDALRAEA